MGSLCLLKGGFGGLTTGNQMNQCLVNSKPVEAFEMSFTNCSPSRTQQLQSLTSGRSSFGFGEIRAIFAVPISLCATSSAKRCEKRSELKSLVALWLAILRLAAAWWPNSAIATCGFAIWRVQTTSNTGAGWACDLQITAGRGPL